MSKSTGYNTRQKENLLAFLVKNKERHTNVQEISAYLSGEGISVGTATIYRQLDRLVEQGIVRKYILDGKSVFTSRCDTSRKVNIAVPGSTISAGESSSIVPFI